MKPNKTQTLDYYNSHSSEFIDGTLNVDMSELYTRFLPLIPEGGKILDVGCGPGRDTLSFFKLGFEVDAFDGSEELVKFARAYTGVDVKLSDFLNYSSDKKFDGIWACASLLHLPPDELKIAFTNLSKLLKYRGIFYVSFKFGNREEVIGDRYFNFINEDSLSKLLKNTNLNIQELWMTEDLRPGRNDKWLNAILEKK